MKFPFRSYSLYTALFLSCALALSSCGGESDEEIFGEEEGGSGGGAMTIDPATAGTITGKVVFEGTAPAPEAVSQDSDPVCATASSGLKADVTQPVVVSDGKLANVFVYISEGIDGSFAPPTDPVLFDQQGCRYHPHVAGAMVGQKIQFKNSDPTLHNVHASPTKNPGFNLAQATQGKVDEKSFEQPEVMIPVTCDVHGWMKSYVGVLPHPFYSVSANDGAFSLKGVPPGTYTVTAWHEKLGEQKQQVVVKEKETKDIAFTFKAQ
jgi:hypothetical protein